MLTELQGLEYTVTVPKQKVVRVKKIKRRGDRIDKGMIAGAGKTLYRIDFRGIRSGNCIDRLSRGKRYCGVKSAFNSPKTLKKAIDDYFNSCYDYIYDECENLCYNRDGKPVKKQVRPFTVSGLALSIGIGTQTLNRYCTGNFDEDMCDDPHLLTYKGLLQKARQRIESFAETKLYDRNGSFGAKFVLDAAFGWCTQNERSQIEERTFSMWLKKEELNLKKQLAELGTNTDGLEIRIVKKED